MRNAGSSTNRRLLEFIGIPMVALVLSGAAAAADDPSQPSSPVKLIFIHHSTGGNWLGDEQQGQDFGGGLGQALMANNYYVSATNYGWSVNGDPIGDRTDIGHWWDWFRGANRDQVMHALFNESGQNLGSFPSWTRMSQDPGGENEIIVFKSCYPNSHISGNPNDPPTTGDNPMRGAGADLGWGGSNYTVGNAKGIYNDILEYFATRTDKLWVLITPPPIAPDDMYHSDEHTATHAANARALNDWLVNDWLDGYPHANVAVFDFFNVLTSNGGGVWTNDAGSPSGNHHRWTGSHVEHVQHVDNDFSSYGAYHDSHPTDAGGGKATVELVPLLNIFYNRFSNGGSPPPGGSPTLSDPGDFVFVIDASAKAAGAAGTNWLTDLALNNPLTRSAQAALFFLDRGQNNSAAAAIEITVPAYSAVLRTDVVASVFGESNTTGAIVVGSDAPLIVTSKTYNDQGAQGTYGQFIPAFAAEEALDAGERARLPQLASNSDFRTNVGFVNLSNLQITVHVEVYNGSGSHIGDLSYDLRPYEYYQKTDLIGSLTASEVNSAFAVVVCYTSGGRYLAYASVVDNRSGDPVFVAAVSENR